MDHNFLEKIEIKELIPKGDGKNFYGYDKQGNAHDIQRITYNRGGTVYLWYSTVRGIYDGGFKIRERKRVRFINPPQECLESKAYLERVENRRIT